MPDYDARQSWSGTGDMTVLKDIVKRSLGRPLGLAQRNYRFAKFYYMYQKGKELKRFSGSPLIIYQMGKVGSKSVKRSLEALNLDMAIYHSHLLTKTRICETEKQRKKFFRTQRESYLKRPWMNQFLREQIDKGLKGIKWKIVTLIRDPVARNVSTFFENLEIQSCNDQKEFVIASDYYGIAEHTIHSDEVQTLTELFFEKLRHDSPIEFFERELKGVFGVDVYATEFHKAQGYQIYKDVCADVLLIRLEDLDRCAGGAFKEFLGIENFRLVHENIATQKIYAPLYSKFKEEIRFPESYLDKFYDSKLMKHFYSEQERSSFRERWQR
jgi:hypothetical protein